MADGAAFFDLDRTLLRGASGPVISEALRTAGVLADRTIPGERLVYRVFDLIGETRPSMALTRQAARFASGWVREAVQAAGEQAAEVARRRHPAVRPAADRGAPGGGPRRSCSPPRRRTTS